MLEKQRRRVELRFVEHVVVRVDAAGARRRVVRVNVHGEIVADDVVVRVGAGGIGEGDGSTGDDKGGVSDDDDRTLAMSSSSASRELTFKRKSERRKTAAGDDTSADAPSSL